MDKRRRKPLPVYFDANIFGDLVSPENQYADKWLRVIENKIAEKHIRIIPSWETIQESLFVSENNQSECQSRQGLYRRIVDWLYLLKPTDELFMDDILSFAHTGNSTIPFVRPGHQLWSEINSIRFGRKYFSEKTIRELCPQTVGFNQGFVNKVLRRVDPKKARQILNNMRKSNSNEKMQWLCLWQTDNTAHTMARNSANILNVLKECEERGIDNLLQIPTIRLTIGYTLHSWFMQTFQNKANFIPSDASDSRHATCAGAVGNMVTNDKRLRAAIEHIPGHNVKVWSLSDFIDYCAKSFSL